MKYSVLMRRLQEIHTVETNALGPAKDTAASARAELHLELLSEISENLAQIVEALPMAGRGI